jgi:outer membrane protein assembly factor BamD (BamD/ComL family)
MNFAFHQPLRWTFLAAIIVFATLAGALVHAQTPSPSADQERFDLGQQLSEAGKYAEAIKAFESIEKEFPTSSLIPAANLKTGACYVSSGAYDGGVAALRKNLNKENIPQDLVEVSQALLSQWLQAKAQRLAPGDREQRAAFGSAITACDSFLEKFPRSRAIEQVNLGKAQCYYALGMSEQAAKVLRENVARFPGGASASESHELLARIIAAQDNAPAEPPAPVDNSPAAQKALDLRSEAPGLRTPDDLPVQNGESSSADSGKAAALWICAAFAQGAAAVGGLMFLRKKLHGRQRRSPIRANDGPASVHPAASTNGAPVSLVKKVFNYRHFYFELLLRELPHALASDRWKTKSKAEEREPETASTPRGLEDRGREAILAGNLDLIARQRDFIERQRKLIQRQSRLIEEKDRLLMEMDQLVARQSGMLERSLF